MICTCFGQQFDTAAIGRAARVILGVPDYDAYVAHLAAVHPEQTPVAREVFYRERQAARLRCC